MIYQYPLCTIIENTFPEKTIICFDDMRLTNTYLIKGKCEYWEGCGGWTGGTVTDGAWDDFTSFSWKDKDGKPFKRWTIIHERSTMLCVGAWAARSVIGLRKYNNSILKANTYGFVMSNSEVTFVDNKQTIVAGHLTMIRKRPYDLQLSGRADIMEVTVIGD